MSTTAHIEPKTKIVGANHTDVQISANPWNESRIVTGGATGGVFVRDAAQAEGWGLVDAAAGVLTCSGVGAMPVFSATPTFGAYIAVGTNPAQSGAIRLGYAQYIKSRNNDNTADRYILGLDTYGSVNRVMLGEGNARAIVPGSGDRNGDLGASDARWDAGFFGSSVVIGTNPANGGSVRLPNAGLVMARNGANTADLHVISLNVNNQVLIGDTAVPAVAYSGIVILGTNATASFPSLRNSGANVQCTTADGAKYTPFTAAEIRAQISSTESGFITADGALVIGSSGTALGGSIRLRHDASIKFRAASGSGDLYFLSFGTESSGTQEIVYLGSSGLFAVAPGATTTGLGTSTTPWAWLSLGANPAQQGAIRLQNHGVIFARNAANTTDIHLLEVNTDNHIYIGQAGSHLLPNNHNVQDIGLAPTWAFRTGYFATSLVTSGYYEAAEMTAPAAPAADKVRIYAEDNGAGKTRVMALFATGAAVQVAIQP